MKKLILFLSLVSGLLFSACENPVGTNNEDNGNSVEPIKGIKLTKEEYLDGVKSFPNLLSATFEGASVNPSVRTIAGENETIQLEVGNEKHHIKTQEVATGGAEYELIAQVINQIKERAEKDSLSSSHDFTNGVVYKNFWYALDVGYEGGEQSFFNEVVVAWIDEETAAIRGYLNQFGVESLLEIAIKTTPVNGKNNLEIWFYNESKMAGISLSVISGYVTSSFSGNTFSLINGDEVRGVYNFDVEAEGLGNLSFYRVFRGSGSETNGKGSVTLVSAIMEREGQAIPPTGVYYRDGEGLINQSQSSISMEGFDDIIISGDITDAEGNIIANRRESSSQGGSPTLTYEIPLSQLLLGDGSNQTLIHCTNAGFYYHYNYGNETYLVMEDFNFPGTYYMLFDNDLPPTSPTEGQPFYAKSDIAKIAEAKTKVDAILADTSGLARDFTAQETVMPKMPEF